MTIAETCKTWKNNFESHRDGFDVLPAHFEWHRSDFQLPELALGFVTSNASVEQPLHITGDRSGVEVSPQGCEVWTVDRYGHEGGDGGGAGIERTSTSEPYVPQARERGGKILHIIIRQAKGTRAGGVGVDVHRNQIPELHDGRY